MSTPFSIYRAGHPADLLPTVEIVHPDGAEHGTIRINASDFDPAIHQRADAAEGAESEAPDAADGAAEGKARRVSKGK